MGIARTRLMGEIYYSLCTLATFSAKKKKKKKVLYQHINLQTGLNCTTYEHNLITQ